MRELHLFAGAGGGILGGMLLGHTCVCAVEIEPYRRKVLLQRQRDGILPKFPIWDDVCTFNGEPWNGWVDIVCGGFPCQDISVAGKGIGIEGDRSGLWKQMARIIRQIRPRFVLVENSPALVVRGLGRVLIDLAQMGYDARWGVLGSKDANGHCDGKRLWIIAKTSKSRWPEVVCSEQRGFPKKINREQAINARSRSRLNRIHALEQMVGETAILGSNDGTSKRVDRLAGIGDGQFPPLVRLAWNTLSEGLI